MIDAIEARRESTINSNAKKYLEALAKNIVKAVEKGEFKAMINISLLEPGNRFLKESIVNKLQELGYIVEFKFADPLPPGCRSDQWQFENGYIKVRWEN